MSSFLLTTPWSEMELDLHAFEILELLNGAKAVVTAKCKACGVFGFAYWHSGNRVTHGTVGVDRPIRIEEFIVDWLPELDDAELHSVIRENLFAKDVCGGSHFACDLDEDSVSRL